MRDLFAGEYPSAFRGRGIEFAEVREYQPGDDVRTIDWNVTARLGVTYVNGTTRSGSSPSCSWWTRAPRRRSAAGAAPGRARRRGGAPCWPSAARANDRVGAAFFTDGLGRMVPPRKGRRHALRVMSELLAPAPRADTDLAAALDALEPMLPRRVVLVILSDFYTSGYQLPLARLARRHEVICMQLRDPIEQALPPVGLVRLRDPESGEHHHGGCVGVRPSGTGRRTPRDVRRAR